MSATPFDYGTWSRLLTFVVTPEGKVDYEALAARRAGLERRDPDRVIEVAWGSAGAHAYEVDIEIRGYDRKGLQKDVTNVVSNANVHIVASSSRVFASSGEVEVRFTLRVHDFEQLSTLLGKLGALPNVVDARRIAGS